MPHADAEFLRPYAACIRLNAPSSNAMLRSKERAAASSSLQGLH
ncbi:hypothetical protein [Candidatus Accumulibacter sp. ACC012]|nr:hypothetical protein [Candidatus Accumulibacter sp. ACC012]